MNIGRKASTTTTPPDTSGQKPEHQGICGFCLLNCFWQDAPTGGWWIHDWPNKTIEELYKTHPHLKHDASPGWDPVIPDKDVI